MKIALSTALIVTVAACYAQKPSDWRTVSQSASSLAAKMDAGLLKLTKAKAEGQYNCDYEGGKNQGNALTNLLIRDRKNFKLDLIRISKDAGEEFTSPLLLANKGSMYYFSAAAGLKKLAPGKDPNILTGTGTLSQRWPKNFVQVILQSFVTGKGPFSALIADLSKPTSGYSLRVDSRTLQSGDRKFPQFRIVAVRKAALAKKLGASQFEIITENSMWLPLQIRVDQGIPIKGGFDKVFYEWTLLWTGPASFPDKVFDVPGAKSGQRP